jgi:hypothetical protein
VATALDDHEATNVDEAIKMATARMPESLFRTLNWDRAR